MAGRQHSRRPGLQPAVDAENLSGDEGDFGQGRERHGASYLDGPTMPLRDPLSKRMAGSTGRLASVRGSGWGRARPRSSRRRRAAGRRPVNASTRLSRLWRWHRSSRSRSREARDVADVHDAAPLALHHLGHHLAAAVDARHKVAVDGRAHLLQGDLHRAIVHRLAPVGHSDEGQPAPSVRNPSAVLQCYHAAYGPLRLSAPGQGDNEPMGRDAIAPRRRAAQVQS